MHLCPAAVGIGVRARPVRPRSPRPPRQAGRSYCEKFEESSALAMGSSSRSSTAMRSRGWARCRLPRQHARAPRGCHRQEPLTVTASTRTAFRHSFRQARARSPEGGRTGSGGNAPTRRGEPWPGTHAATPNGMVDGIVPSGRCDLVGPTDAVFENRRARSALGSQTGSGGRRFPRPAWLGRPSHNSRQNTRREARTG